jgi:hypothetical protein
VNHESGKDNQNEDADIQITTPGWDRTLCRTRNQKYRR